MKDMVSVVQKNVRLKASSFREREEEEDTFFVLGRKENKTNGGDHFPILRVSLDFAI